MENNCHSIILIQFEEDVRTRTYLHYETVNEALESLCNVYEQKLKSDEPLTKTVSYDIAQLFLFIDKLRDLSFLIFSNEKRAYSPYGKEWIKSKLFNYLKSQIGSE